MRDAVEITGLVFIYMLFTFPWLFFGAMITFITARTLKAVMIWLSVSALVNALWLYFLRDALKFDEKADYALFVLAAASALVLAVLVGWIVRRLKGKPMDLSAIPKDDVRITLPKAD